jgi:hypothetical protein
MLWNAPIWLNEMLVDIIKFSVGLFIAAGFISTIGLVYKAIYKIIYKIKNKRRMTCFSKDILTLILLGSLLVSCIGLILFYMPQQVLPDEYNFDEISIRIITPSSETDRITIKDKEGLDEFRELFRGSICRRSDDLGRTTLYLETVCFIDLTVFDRGRVSPLHFVVTQGKLRRYTAGNTDFIYIIEDDEHLLASRVFNYAHKYAEVGKQNELNNGD